MFSFCGLLKDGVSHWNFFFQDRFHCSGWYLYIISSSDFINCDISKLKNLEKNIKNLVYIHHI